MVCLFFFVVVVVFLFVCLFVCFCLFGLAPLACGSFQARGRIGAVATGLRYSSQQCWILPFLKFISYFLFFCFLGLQPWHMELPRLGVESELQLPAYATATATGDPSCICDLHHSSWQRWIPYPLREARDQTRNLMVPSWICFCCAMTRTPIFLKI